MTTCKNCGQDFNWCDCSNEEHNDAKTPQEREDDKREAHFHNIANRAWKVAHGDDSEF